MRDGPSASSRVSTRPFSLEGFPVTLNDVRRFTEAQLFVLFQFFVRSLYPSSADYDLLASLSGLARKQIVAWFRSHRASFRRRLRSHASA